MPMDLRSLTLALLVSTLACHDSPSTNDGSRWVQLYGKTGATWEIDSRSVSRSSDSTTLVWVRETDSPSGLVVLSRWEVSCRSRAYRGLQQISTVPGPDGYPTVDTTTFMDVMRQRFADSTWKERVPDSYEEWMVDGICRYLKM